MDEKEVSFSSQQVFRCTEVEIEVFHTYKKYINFISKEHERKILAQFPFCSCLDRSFRAD